MTPTQMIAIVQGRTKHPSTTKIGTELQAAYRWAQRRLYNTENGPDLLIVVDEELAINARTRDYELSTNLAHTFLGVKTLWLKLPTDTIFTPMTFADTSSLEFVRIDSDPASSTLVASGHPVFYDVVNFSQLHFGPAIPASSTLRVDYYRLAADIDVSGSDTPTEVPSVLQQIEDAVIDRTTARVFRLLDDSRELTYEQDANSNLTDAIWALNRRNQGPTQTTPYRARRRRFI